MLARAAKIPNIVARTEATQATSSELRTAFHRSASAQTFWNHCVVKPFSGKATTVLSLKANSGSSNREMYEVFNMGCRLEIYCSEADAQMMIDAAKAFDIAAQIIGRVEAGEKKELVIRIDGEEIIF